MDADRTTHDPTAKDPGGTRDARRRPVGRSTRHAGPRLLGAGILALVATLPTSPASAAVAGYPGADPWPPLGIIIRSLITMGWDCAGLPHEPPAIAGATGRTSGTARCDGTSCTWDLDDDRLDGIVARDGSGPCVGLTNVPGPDGTCPWAPLTLTGPTGTWIGSWSRMRSDDRQVMLRGTGALAPLIFIGQWTDPDSDDGRIVGLVTRDRGAVELLWPVPIL
ncbi:MAG: hypothetical protein U0869_22710 [Chloroflexota bacterium]